MHAALEMESIKGFFRELYVKWMVASLIVWGVHLFILSRTADLGDILTELLLSFIVESFMFPLNFIVGWIINPNPITMIFSLALFLLIVVLTKWRSSGL